MDLPAGRDQIGVPCLPSAAEHHLVSLGNPRQPGMPSLALRSPFDDLQLKWQEGML